MKKSIKKTLGIACVIATSLLVGCQPVKVMPPVSYGLSDDSADALVSHGMHKEVLYIAPVQSTLHLNTRAMLYSTQPYRYAAFVHHRWSASPANMLLPRLVSGINRKHYFRAVVAGPISGRASYQLSTRLLAWDIDLYYPKPRVHITLSATVMNEETHNILSSRRISVTRDIVGKGPYAAVLAMNAAVDRLEQDVANFVVSSLAK